MPRDESKGLFFRKVPYVIKPKRNSGRKVAVSIYALKNGKVCNCDISVIPVSLDPGIQLMSVTSPMVFTLMLADSLVVTDVMVSLLQLISTDFF